MCPQGREHRKQNQIRKFETATVSDDQYAVFNEFEYAVSIFLNEYDVLDKKVGYVISNGSGYAVLGYRLE
ncbi:hypothetical protein Tco_1344336 [Tanacetum coccineum]